MPDIHFEPYLVLAGLAHDAALIAWGGFYFRVRGLKGGESWKIVDDGDLKRLHPPRFECIGARSTPYGHALVEVWDAGGARVFSAETSTCNHVWATKLEPDTEYTYRVTVNGEVWGDGPRRDWVEDGDAMGLVRDATSPRQYTNRFKTFPHPASARPFAFAVLGDYGVGIRSTASHACQRDVAAALERVALENDVRFLLTTGDNIYAKQLLGVPIASYGDEDDDWFFTFHQPYRYLLNRIPVYPTVGNHDSADIEENDDREQVIDNLYLRERFLSQEAAGRASIGPGLFYRFRFGALAEFVALDTSRATVLPGTPRLFRHANHRAFVEACLPEGEAPRTAWLMPFGHHPAYCAGPRHGNTGSVVEFLVPRFLRAGVRVAFAGHEHNYQHSVANGIHYFVTGAGGKVRSGTPRNIAEAHTVAWASEGHFLLVRVDQEKVEVTPIGRDGRPLALNAVLPRGDELPVIIRRTPA